MGYDWSGFSCVTKNLSDNSKIEMLKFLHELNLKNKNHTKGCGLIVLIFITICVAIWG